MHVKFSYENKKLFLEVPDQYAGDTTFVNGVSCDLSGESKFRVELKDLDRIIIGTTSTFLVRIPIDGVFKDAVNENGEGIDWEFC